MSLGLFRSSLSSGSNVRFYTFANPYNRHPVRLDGFIDDIIPDQKYTVEIMIMRGDMNSGSEYVNIYLNDVNYGRCNGGNQNRGNLGDWYNCTSEMNKKTISSSTSNIKVRLQYSSGVSSSTSYRLLDSYTGKEGYGGLARVILFPTGKVIFRILITREMTFLSW